jgi:exopolysaccharide biosynthesis operon protein EpsL
MYTSGHSCARGGGALGPPALVLLILAAGAVSWAGDARALWDGKLEPFVSHSVMRDDNVFRISGQSDPLTALGAPSKADTVNTTSVGLNLNLPLSRQRILGGLSFSKNRYDRFTVLDFTERHARASWQWQVGSDFSGQLGYTNDRALASLANVQGGIQGSTPNALETKKTFVDATYRVTPRWQLRGEVSRIEQDNELAERQANDIRNDGAGLALSYVTPAETRIGLELQRQDGELPNPQLVNATLVDNSYRQDRVAVAFDWTVSGLSRLRASAGRVERSFVQLPLRDHSTGIFHADYEWRPTDKLTLVAAAQKDIAAPDEINAGVNIGFVLVKGIALRPVYRMTEEVSVSGLLDYSDLEYLGDPGLALGTVAPRSDRVRTVALAVSYQPIRAVRLHLGLRRETRTSTAAFGDYEADIVSLGARLAF